MYLDPPLAHHSRVVHTRSPYVRAKNKHAQNRKKRAAVAEVAAARPVIQTDRNA